MHPYSKPLTILSLAGATFRSHLSVNVNRENNYFEYADLGEMLLILVDALQTMDR
jgi:hypothetical protein